VRNFLRGAGGFTMCAKPSHKAAFTTSFRLATSALRTFAIKTATSSSRSRVILNAIKHNYIDVSTSINMHVLAKRRYVRTSIEAPA
jgi:hypothetical protein